MSKKTLVLVKPFCQPCSEGIEFRATFDIASHKALVLKLRQLGVGGPFLAILTEFLKKIIQRIVADGHY